MFRDYLLLLLVGHVLGDFYIQTEKIAKEKENSFRWVLKHCFFYLLTMITCFLPVISLNLIVLVCVVSLLHGIIDVNKFFFQKKYRKSSSSIFLIDQCIHLFFIVLSAYICTQKNIVLKELKIFSDFFDVVNLSEREMCSWILGMLLIHKPANILIQNLIGSYKTKFDNIEIKSDNNIGRVIGTVERVIMLLFIYMNQYSAIGFVLTAKSIARYDRISKDEKFAEYYLLGTLISTGIVIICGVLLS